MSFFSDEELEMDFEAGFSTSDSEISSSYNSDSGVSIHTPLSSSSWSPSEFDAEDDRGYFSHDLSTFYQTHSYGILQAIQCLSDQNFSVVLGASAYLFHLCKNGYVPVISQLHPDFFVHLKASLTSAFCWKHLDILHCISGIINYFSQSADGVYLILHHGGLEILNGLLLFPAESILYFCITALHNVLLSHKTARSFVHRTNAANILINLLNLSVEQPGAFQYLTFNIYCHQSHGANPKFLAVLCDCLYILAYRHEHTKRSFRELGGLSSLLQLILNSSYEKVLWTATRLLRVLSAWILFKRDILLHDPSLSFFAHCMECHSQRVAANVLWTMRNLSDVIFDKLPFEVASNIVNQLLSRLKANTDLGAVKSPYFMRDEASVSRCVLGTLANLTCRNYIIKGYVVQHNGIDLIVRILSTELKHYTPMHDTISRCDDSVLLSGFLSNLAINSCRSSTPHLTGTTTSQVTIHNCKTKHSSSRSTHNTSNANLVDSLIVDNNLIKQCHASRQLFNSITQNQFNDKNTSLSNSLHNNNEEGSGAGHGLTAILDLLEGGLRCLSHLTTTHSELISVHNYFSQQRAASKFLVLIGKLFFPTVLQSLISTLTSSYSSGSIPSPSMSSILTHSNNHHSAQSNTVTSTSVTNGLDWLKQLFQLIKIWAIIIRNLGLTIPTTGTVIDCNNKRFSEQNDTCITESDNHKLSDLTTDSTVSSLQLWPHHLRVQLRHSVQSLVTFLRRISNTVLAENAPTELLHTTLNAMHDLSSTIAAVHSTAAAANIPTK